MRSLFPAFCCLLLGFCLSCKKEKTLPPDPVLTEGYKLVVESGNNQSDTIGNELKIPLSFKYTLNGDTLSSGYLRIGKTDCDGNLNYQEYWVGKENVSFSEWTLRYIDTWQLNSTVGQQQLIAILLDSVKVPQDTVVVTATGIAPQKGWHVSGCTGENFATALCNLPSGRLLAGVHEVNSTGEVNSLLYSDDEGVSWHALNTLPKPMQIRKLISTPQNEVFLASDGNGVYYSPDGGQTWQERNNGLNLYNYYGDISFTASGVLITFAIDNMYYSLDKGINWQVVQLSSVVLTGLSEACSLSDGTLVAINQNTPIVSKDSGNLWRPINGVNATPAASAVFVDDNDDVYIAMVIGSGGYGLYVSKDKLQTWTKVYTPIGNTGFYPHITQIKKINGSYYFYPTTENILTKTDDFVTYQSIGTELPNNYGRQSETYTVSAHQHYILSKQFRGMYYYLPE